MEYIRLFPYLCDWCFVEYYTFTTMASIMVGEKPA